MIMSLERFSCSVKERLPENRNGGAEERWNERNGPVFIFVAILNLNPATLPTRKVRSLEPQNEVSVLKQAKDVLTVGFSMSS